VYGASQSNAVGNKSNKNATLLTRTVTLIVFLVLVSGIWLILATYRDSDTRYRADLIRQAQLLSESLDPELLRNLTGTEADLDSPSYQRIKQHLILLRSAYTNIRFIYLMNRRDNGEIYFLADSEPPESDDYSPPGQVYNEADAVESRMFQDVQQAVDGPTTDRWGTWITAYVVISDPNTDRTLALFGIDIAADAWNRSLLHSTNSVLFAMLLLLGLLLLAHRLFMHRLRFEGTEPTWMTWIEPVCVISTGLILSIAGAHYTYHRISRTQQQDFHLLAASDTQQIASRIRELRYKDLIGIKSFIESSRDITSEEFSQYTDALLKDPAIYAWAWIPEVTEDHRIEFIKNAQAAGIAMQNIWVLDEQDQSQPAENKPVYFPIFYINPLTGNETGVGFDSLSEPHRRQAIQAAMQTKLPVCTPPLRLALRNKNVDSVIVYQPILDQHRGCVAMSINLHGILPVARKSSILHYHLKSLNLGASPTELTSSRDANHPENEFVLSRPIAVFNDVYLIVAHRNDEHFIDHSVVYASWMLGSGCAVTMAIALLVGMPIRRREAMRAMVTARTSELREQEGKFRLLTESMQDVIWTLDADSLRFTYVSPSVFKRLGFTAEEIMASPLSMILAAKQYDTLVGLIKQRAQALREGLIAEDTFFVNEVEQPCRDGRSVWTEIVTSIKKNRDNGRIEVHGVSRDISERRQAEAALRENQQFLSDLIEHSGALIYVKDREGNYELVNRKWEETTGLHRDQVLGKSDFDLFPKATAQSFVTNDQAVMERGIAIETEEQLESLTGNRRFLSVKFPWRDHQGNVIGSCGVTSEITALKQSEENLRAHVDELQRWYDITIGRENRVLELKSEVNTLLTRLGEPVKYENT